MREPGKCLNKETRKDRNPGKSIIYIPGFLVLLVSS
jgi:hypothetical protein